MGWLMILDVSENPQFKVLVIFQSWFGWYPRHVLHQTPFTNSFYNFYNFYTKLPLHHLHPQHVMKKKNEKNRCLLLFGKPGRGVILKRPFKRHREHGWIDQWLHFYVSTHHEMVLKCLVGGNWLFHTLRNFHGFLWIPMIDSFQISTLRDSRTASQRRLPVHHNLFRSRNLQRTIKALFKGQIYKIQSQTFIKGTVPSWN